MEYRLAITAQSVDGAREKILDCIRLNKRNKKIFYFYGWINGLGAAPVLRSVAQELRSIKTKRSPSELCFDRIIYIDCSTWESRRVMQRKIAEELELDLGMIDKQDEEDDFNGVDHGSRDLIRDVSEEIFQTLVNRKLMMVFLNGSDDEVDLNKFGISPDSLDHVILWTFKRRSLTIHDDAHYKEILFHKLRYTHLFVLWPSELAGSQFYELLREEVASIVARHPSMQGIDITMATKCCLYELFLQHSFHRATGFDWAAHAPSYWMCDGITKRDGTRDISDKLHQEINWEINSSRVSRVYGTLMQHPEAPLFLFVEDEIKRSYPWISGASYNPLLIRMPYPWISVTSKNPIIHEGTDKALLAKVSSLFIALGKSDDPQGLPDEFLKHCNNLGVLTLSHCAFSFVSPPFLRCHKMRFLGLDHCTHDNTSEGENKTNWSWLQNLWVLDLRYTEWDDILSEEKIDNMTNLMELDIEGFMCWQLVNRLHGKLPYLQRLRIIKPIQKADTSIDSTSSLFVNKTGLEILDLSGNRDMQNLSISSSVARSLQMLILDGCDGLENVVVADGLPSSLRLFSFDGYGPATRWTSSFKLAPKSSEQKHNSHANTSAVKTSKISMQGCTQLENFFVRGLPNLEELDLSGSAIKVLDFGTMMINVPGLKRLILLGCEHLRAINWPFDSIARLELASLFLGPSFDSREQFQLELLCVDTRPWRAQAHGPTRPCLAEHKKSFVLQLHATLADARLARSLYTLFEHYAYDRDTYRTDTYFNIHVTSSDKYGEVVQAEATREAMIQVILYGDAFFNIDDVPMLFFPQPPTHPLDHHVEISDASRGLEGELARPAEDTLAGLMRQYAESLHVHNVSTSASMPAVYWNDLKWFRIERCPNLGTVFPQEASGSLQTVWVSHLLMARCIWSKGFDRADYSFKNLQHLHLQSCPRLKFVLPVWVASFPSLETLHIIHCGDLTHVLPLDKKYPKKIAVHGLPFPKLATIHLHDLPKLRQICEVKMLAPALQTIRIRGCFGLRRLPALAGRKPGLKKPTVEIEKDVWDSLEWDGMGAGHHPDLFEPPVHSRYYRWSRLLRGTVLR